jgi:tetratricopeptide (TPR) repeat protein
MEIAKIGINKTLKAFQHWASFMVALAIIVIFFSVSLPVASSMAHVIDKNQANMDAVLEKAHAEIAQDQPDPAKLRQAISLLEGYKSQFPAEIRFPLYLAEAYYRLADPDADVSREYVYYEKTGSSAEQALALNPNCAEAHYWHGLFLLRKAHKQGGIGAFFTVRKGIAELERVRQTMPRYDHAGASRVLGLLYFLAPGWTPFGNLSKSIAMEEEATRLAPDFSLNHLYLANAYKRQGNKEGAIREYKAILTASAARSANQANDISEQARTNLRELDISG